jgi:hypothetical protein
MKSLKSVIQVYAAGSKKLGETTFTLNESEQANLREDLNKISLRNGKIFWVVLSMVLLLFILALLLVGFNQDKPDKIKLIFGITGVSIMGLIYYMTKIWKEKNYIDMTLILVRTLDKEMINSILTALLARL